MKTMTQLEKDLPQFEAVALIEERRLEPGLMPEEPDNGGADKSFPLEEARRLARSILRLDGLTGVERVTAGEAKRNLRQRCGRRI
jgi:hypothetical protein